MDADRVLRPDAIIATNTSSISITRLATATGRPDRFIGMHFFNPVPLMALVELIRGLQTSDATMATADALTRRLGKTPITVRNSPGFVVNRILCPMINEAIFAYSEGLASAEEIDNGMKLGCNHPIGPLALADMIGLDVMLAVMKVFYEGFNDPKYRPAPPAQGNGRRRISGTQERARVLYLRVTDRAAARHRDRQKRNDDSPGGHLAGVRDGLGRTMPPRISGWVFAAAAPAPDNQASGYSQNALDARGAFQRIVDPVCRDR